MGAETTVYGYICLIPAHRKLNEGVLARWSFDQLYPFPNIFSGIHRGYGGDVIAFAGNLMSLDEDWPEWESRFENLLSNLQGRSARVHLEHETDGEIKSVGYVFHNDGSGPSNLTQSNLLTKWYYGKD